MRSRRVAATGRHDDTGSAVVEFLGLGVLLLVPLVYLVVTLGRVQAAAFAVDSAAGAAARVFTTAPDEATARSRALAVVRLALRDQGFADDPAVATRISCPAGGCLGPRARVEVQVSVDVTLPGVPSVVDRRAGTHVVIRSTRVSLAGAFRPEPR